MSRSVETDADLPPWVTNDARADAPSEPMRKHHSSRMTGERSERTLHPRPPEVVIEKPRSKTTRKLKRAVKAPDSGEWEVQVKTGGSGRTKWGWLQSVQGLAPDKAHIRDHFGPGHYRVVEQGSGYAQEFTIARVPASGFTETSEPMKQPDHDSDIESVVQKAVGEAVQRAMASTMQAMRPLLESMKAKPGDQNEGVEQLRADLSQLSGLVRALAERPSSPQVLPQSGPPWQMAIIEKVMTAGLSNMGIQHDDEDEEEDEGPGMEEKLLDIGTTILGAVMQNRGAPVTPGPAIPLEQGQIAQQQPGQSASPPTGSLPGMTPEIEAELRAYAAKIGYDYDTAIAEANAAGASAQALLEQCRSLIGPLDKK